MIPGAFAGIDGCKGGWLVIVLDENGMRDWKRCVTIHEVIDVTRGTTTALIDIPIGLKDDDPEERTCDRAARTLLGSPRMFSVFRIPPRPAVYAPSYQEACRLSSLITGKKISLQTWGIIPKIREADTVFSESTNLQNRIRETHPELCFLGISGHPMKHSKKTSAGIRERLDALEKLVPGSENALSTVNNNTLRKHIIPDDVIDALA